MHLGCQTTTKRMPNGICRIFLCNYSPFSLDQSELTYCCTHTSHVVLLLLVLVWVECCNFSDWSCIYTQYPLGNTSILLVLIRCRTKCNWSCDWYAMLHHPGQLFSLTNRWNLPLQSIHIYLKLMLIWK